MHIPQHKGSSYQIHFTGIQLIFKQKQRSLFIDLMLGICNFLHIVEKNQDNIQICVNYKSIYV